MTFTFVTDLCAQLAATYGTAVHELGVERCPEHFSGDLTVNCFRLARPLRQAPPAIASCVHDYLSEHPDIESVDTIKAFVNVTLRPGAAFRDAVSDRQALLESPLLPEDRRERVVIEYSAPNTNKPQHLGHVRNNTLGQATTSVLRAVGHTVIPVNLVNDRGVHICKSMVGYQRFGQGETPRSAGRKGDHFVGDFYVRYDQELRRQIDQLRGQHPEWAQKSADELFLETEIGRATQDMLVAWERDDAEVRALWQTMNGWVFDGFRETYQRMGVEFQKTYLESETYNLGKDVVAQGLETGVFQRRDDGAVFIDLEKEKLGDKVVLRSDGTSVYITQDLGTTLLKQHDYQPDRQIWIVGDEQIYHFRVLFAMLTRLGYPWANRLTHMAYGMVNLPGGKMKSREGTVVDADDLFDEMTGLARQATLERAGDRIPDDLEQRAHTIGMGALKFMLLKVNPKTTLMFDPAASIRFEGDTGPYVLYAYARIASMLRKAGDDALDGTVDWSLLTAPEEKDLALRLADYGSTIQRGAQELDTSGIAAYLLELAKSFSRFYRECSVLNADTPELVRARLELSSRVRDVLGAGLHTLTIGTLESM